MGIKTVPHPLYSRDFAPCDFWLFCEAVTNVIDTLAQEDFHGSFQTLLEWYDKCFADGGDYFEGD